MPYYIIRNKDGKAIASDGCRQYLMYQLYENLKLRKRPQNAVYYLAGTAIQSWQLIKDFCVKNGYEFVKVGQNKIKIDPALLLKPYALHYMLGLGLGLENKIRTEENIYNKYPEFFKKDFELPGGPHLPGYNSTIEKLFGIYNLAQGITANYDTYNHLGVEKLRLVVRSLIESKKESRPVKKVAKTP